MPAKRTLILGLIGLAVLVGIVLLAIKVTESPAVAVDEAKLEAAQAAYRQRHGDDPPALPKQVPSLPPRAARSAATDVESEHDTPDPDPPRTAITDRRTPRLKLNPAAPTDVAKIAQMPEEALKERMADVNKAYDRADYETARDEALKVLQDHPKQTRMLRVVVSSSCIMGDGDMAVEYFDKLAGDRDRRQMARRCQRYGVELQP